MPSPTATAAATTVLASLLLVTMAYLSLIAVLLVGAPVADAFTMSVRPAASSTGGRVQRKDFLKQIAGATTAGVAGVACSPLASVAASSECSHRFSSMTSAGQAPLECSHCVRCVRCS